MTEGLYSLKEAADQLGVHPVTLRRWAESGKIESVRTPGGHRRFPESELKRLTNQSEDVTSESFKESFRENALSYTRADLGDHTASWNAGLEEQDREEKRMLGRRLMGLLIQYVGAEETENEEVLEEARIVARVYAKNVVRNGIPLQDALKAVNFFRDHILESAVVLPDVSRRRPEANQRMFRKLNAFLNEMQLVIANCYEILGAVIVTGKEEGDE
ncbi:MAG: excisionase family DNA-binding protein [Bacteroidetes bacterium]|nr:excisionase family DNA-binding protein [Bacteroidota bacterium]